jgi:hypothetical protein
MFFQEIQYRGRIMRLMVGSFGLLSSRFKGKFPSAVSAGLQLMKKPLKDLLIGAAIKPNARRLF